MPTGRIKLQMINARGSSLGETIDISLLHLPSGTRQVVRRRQGNKAMTIAGLKEPPDGLYRVEVDPPSYLPVGVFANTLNADAVRLIFPIDPAKVTGTRFPAFDQLALDAQRLLTASNQVLAFSGLTAELLWAALDDIRRAGFLNIIAKTATTAFTNTRTVASYLRELREIRGDRFFVDVPHELREETKNAVLSGLFFAVDGSLHHPPPGFTSAGSFKTQDRYGNLQLTFFSDGLNWRADVDIDDAGGLEHVFQVLRNTLTGRPTHPFDIHEILLVHQHLDPGYDLLVAGD
ncbi:MAG TPA: hypothetical protein VEK56_03245 [Vicinamibacterales bacterium]|nr:hypothetical protein [Vicinamibacterales bacterium]